MKTLNMSQAPKQVKDAFNAVKSVFPDVSMVIYDEDGRWCYCDQNSNAPDFNDQISVDLLEDGADAVDYLPITFKE
ncbi:hypothetical protein [Salmonella phage NINP13076]|uniref:Uncharacterized protein n=1 Tax=Salmonella phage SalP219 TaxID=3158864 RepID=A0AAU7PIN1_9CAUD|nr:hypothetical protein [Salmonella phage NINP13076]